MENKIKTTNYPLMESSSKKNASLTKQDDEFRRNSTPSRHQKKVPKKKRQKLFHAKTSVSDFLLQQPGKRALCDIDFISKSKLRVDDKKLVKVNNDIQRMLSSLLAEMPNNNENICSSSNIEKKSQQRRYKISKFTPTKPPNEYDYNEKIPCSTLLLSSDSNKSKISKTVKEIEEKNIKIVPNVVDAIFSNQLDENPKTSENNKNCLIGIGLHSENSSKCNYNNLKSIRKDAGHVLSTTNANKKTFHQVRTFFANKRDLVKFENVYDSLSEEEDEYEAEIPKTIIPPNSTFRQVWDLICALLIFYSIIASPYMLAFEYDNDDDASSWVFYIDNLIDFLFIIDMILNFFTAYIEKEDDILVVSKGKIAMHYLMSYFAFDLISSLPFGMIIFFVNLFSEERNIVFRKNYSNIQKISRLARFYRLLKWTRILRILKLTNTNKAQSSKIFQKIGRIPSSLVRLIKFFIFFVILLHLTACVWVFIGKSQFTILGNDSWMNKFNYVNEEDEEVYLVAVYYNLGTILTVGYGDIRATSTLERGYMLLFMTAGCIIFSFVLSSLSTIFSQIDYKTDIFNRKEILLYEMKMEYHIPEKLNEKIRKSIKHDLKNWNEDRIKLLDSLPGSLRNNLYLIMHQNQIKHLRFFEKQSYNFILYVVPLLKATRFSKTDIIISFGAIVDEMYLIIKGIVSINLGYKYDHYEIGSIRTGDHFGDIIMYLNNDCNYDFKVKTKTCELFLLTKIHFAMIKLNFRYAINDILKHSYNIFIALEKRRLAAISHFKTYGNLQMFKENYITQIKNQKQSSSSVSTVSIDDSKNHNKPIQNPVDASSLEKSEKNIIQNLKLLKNNTVKYKNDYLRNLSLHSISSRSSSNNNLMKGPENGNDTQIRESFHEISKSEDKKNYLVSSKNTQMTVRNFAEDYSNIFTYHNLPKFENSTTANKKEKLILFSKNRQTQKQLKHINDKKDNNKGKMIFISNLNINYLNNNTNDSDIQFITNENSPYSSKSFSRLQDSVKCKRSMSSSITKQQQRAISKLNNNSEKFVYKDRHPSAMNIGRCSVFPNHPKENICGKEVQTPHNQARFSTLFESINVKVGNKTRFLDNLNKKIENEGFLFQNKILVSEHIRDFLKEKEGERNLQQLVKKLGKIEKGLMGFVEQKQSIDKMSSSPRRCKGNFK